MPSEHLTVFYSWQSDTPSKDNRSFIETALQNAISRLNERGIKMEAAERPADLQLDKDTKGVPGSPPIFDTILRKIDAAAVFVADLTTVAQSLPQLVGRSAKPRSVPNPNVLIEYGYALKRHGHSRIIAVMNTAYGASDPSRLPFDLRHCRAPIRYSCSGGATPDPKEKENLVQILADAIEAVLTADAAPSTGAAQFVRADAQVRTFIKWAGANQFFPDLFEDDHEVRPEIPQDGLCYLRFFPATVVEKFGTPMDALHCAKTGALRAMGVDTHFPLRYSRNVSGAAALQWAHQEHVLGVTQLFLSKELFGIDCRAMRTLGFRSGRGPNQQFDPSEVEASLAFTLEVYRRFARSSLSQTGPWTGVAGLSGLKGFVLLNRRCMVEEFEEPFSLTAAGAAHHALRPFFEHMWKQFGVPRAQNADEALLSHSAMRFLRQAAAG